MSDPRRSLALLLLGLVACGPKLPGDEGETAATLDTSRASMPGEDDTGGPTSGADDEGDAITSSAGDEDGAITSSTGVDDEGGAMTMGTGDPVESCELPIDPYDLVHYRLCRGGLATFGAHVFSTGEVGYSAYAQFYEVFAESQVVWDQVVHDPFTGLGDCGARTFGNSGSGEGEQVLWQDAGDLTFVGPGFAVPGGKYGDPQSVLGYDTSLSNLGLLPGWGSPHGLITTGATAPALDLSDVVVLPDRIEVSAPDILGGEVARDALVIEWTPSPLAMPTWLTLHFPAGGSGAAYTVYCQMPDDGSFQVPAALLEGADLPRTARVHMRRSDDRMLPTDGERWMHVTASSMLEGELTVL
jgi:hypothetical protein